MAQPLIKFFRVASRPTTGGVPGALYFVSGEGVLYVCTSESSFEPYSGARNASLSEELLTIVDRDGKEVKVDLSKYVKKEQTIAGIDLEDNITVAELQKALGLNEKNLGGEANVLEGVKVNGQALTIATDKTVDIAVPTKLSELTNDSNYVIDANYVHTDNNYTTDEKTKLAGIEAGAEVNIIETVKVNGVALTPDADRAVDVIIPVKGVKSGEKVLALDPADGMLSTTISMEYQATSEGGDGYIYLKGIDGAELGKINAAEFVKDGMIESVVMGEDNVLTITWNTASGKTEATTIDFTKYIDTFTHYGAAKGIAIENEKYVGVVDGASEAFLTVDEAGFKLSGVQQAINDAVAAKNVTASGDTYVSATVAEGTNHVTVAASETTKASLELADTALQAADITTGAANGTIAVEGKDVAVKGLGDAAYVGLTATPTENSNDAFTAGGAYLLDEKINANTTGIGALNDRIDGLDFGVTSVDASTSSAHVTVAPTTASDGAVTVTVDVASVDAANGGAAGLATDAYVREQVSAAAMVWQEGSF